MSRTINKIMENLKYMQAIVVDKPIGPSGLRLVNDYPVPEIGANDILVQVKAVGLNRADLIQSYGKYNPPPGSICPDIIGLEYAGIVVRVGSRVVNFKIGDRVFGLVASAAMGQYLCTHSQTAILIPQDLDFEVAASLPEAFITAYDALVLQAGVKLNQSVLISAIGSSVGLAALQIAKLYNCIVVGSSRTPDKLKLAQNIGLNFGFTVESGSFVQSVLEYTRQIGVDNVLELVGGNYLKQDIECCSYRACIVIIGLLAGIKTEVNLALILAKRIRIYGTTLRSRDLSEKIELANVFASEILPLVKSGKLKPFITKVYSLKDLHLAFNDLESNKYAGKLILNWS